jgi:anti-sigma B factor antagonist
MHQQCARPGMTYDEKAVFRISSLKSASKISVLAIEGAVDMSNVTRLKEAFEGLFATGVYKIVLDLEKVTFIASAGLGCLLTARDVVLKHAGNMVFSGTNAKVREVFDLLGITNLLRFAPDLAHAQAQLEA